MLVRMFKTIPNEFFGRFQSSLHLESKYLINFDTSFCSEDLDMGRFEVSGRIFIQKNIEVSEVVQRS
jgi:hypothetical protein